MKLDNNQENQTLVIRRNMLYKLTLDVWSVQHLFDTRSKFFSDLIFLYLLPLCIGNDLQAACDARSYLYI